MIEMLEECITLLSPTLDGAPRKMGLRHARAEMCVRLRNAINEMSAPAGTVLAAHTNNTLLRQQFVLNVWLDPGQRVILEDKR